MCECLNACAPWPRCMNCTGRALWSVYSCEHFIPRIFFLNFSLPEKDYNEELRPSCSCGAALIPPCRSHVIRLAR